MVHDKVYNATSFVDEHPYVFPRREPINRNSSFHQVDLGIEGFWRAIIKALGKRMFKALSLIEIAEVVKKS